MTTFLLILLVLLMAAAVFYLARLSRSQKRQLTDLRAEEEAIVAEERRLFGFLHELGEAIWREDQQLVMHRLIVEGAMRVTQSTGGAIYTYDVPTKRLVPRHFSEFCAALHAVPDTVRMQAKENPGAVLSFFRRADISPEEGVLGRIFSAQKSELVPDLGLESGATALVGPLSFGSRRLGILVLTASKDARRFNANDFEVFSSIAEQSAVVPSPALDLPSFRHDTGRSSARDRLCAGEHSNLDRAGAESLEWHRSPPICRTVVEQCAHSRYGFDCV